MKEPVEQVNNVDSAHPNGLPSAFLALPVAVA